MTLEQRSTAGCPDLLESTQPSVPSGQLCATKAPERPCVSLLQDALISFILAKICDRVFIECSYSMKKKLFLYLEINDNYDALATKKIH